MMIPKILRRSILEQLHAAHLGINKTCARANQIVYWPRMTNQIENLVSNCAICNKFKNAQQKETLLPHNVPELPWQKVGVDIYSFSGKDYLIIIDYLSKYPEIGVLNNKGASGLIKLLQEVFSRHGVPQVLIADNVPCNSAEMRKFAKQWNFTIDTSSPKFPRSNGQAERAIQSIKNILRKSIETGSNPLIGIMESRNTPITGTHFSPAQILMSRMLGTTIPIFLNRVRGFSWHQ